MVDGAGLIDGFRLLLCSWWGGGSASKLGSSVLKPNLQHHARAHRGVARSKNVGWTVDTSITESGGGPWSGVKGQSPPEAENLLACAQRKQQIKFASFSIFCKLPKSQPSNRPSSQVKTHWICINLRNDLWQRWGGHVHPVSGPACAPFQHNHSTSLSSWRLWPLT